MTNSVSKLIRATTKQQVYTFDINQLQDGFNTTNYFIIHKQNSQVKYITNRVCDHIGAEFWHYFTNVYIGEEHFRYDSYCGAVCSKPHQKNILF